MSNRYERVLVWEDTVNLCVTGKFKDLTPNESVHFVANDLRLENILLDKKYVTEIKVLNEDTLIVAEILKNSGEQNILVLNLASFRNFGGGVQTGALAQEEELFRRSNYFKTGNSCYPFKKMESVYTQNVTIIKDKKYKVMCEPFNVAMLAVAAIKNPVLEKNNKLCKWDYYVTCENIENIFKIALFYKHDVLVLGAIGCGAYHNPPEEIADIFSKYLKKYDGCFKKIIFAVLSKNDNNFNIFEEKIKKD